MITSAAATTSKLRKAGVTVSAPGRVDYMNEGITYVFSGEFVAQGFAKDAATAGFTVKTFRARVTVTALP